jgi:hypothetical protein
MRPKLKAGLIRASYGMLTDAFPDFAEIYIIVFGPSVRRLISFFFGFRTFLVW